MADSQPEKQPYVFPLSADQISAAIRCPSQAVAFHWPLILADLDDMSLASEAVCVATLGTIAVETAHQFRPIHEYGTVKYFEQHYQGRADLGNVHPGDGVKFHGRGFAQTTGEANYEADGKLIGVDLLANPDKALDPYNAAALWTAYVFDHPQLVMAAKAGDWVHVRKIVNGGTNGLDDFMKCVKQLQAALKQVS